MNWEEIKFTPHGWEDKQDYESMKKLITDIICDHECLDPSHCRVCDRIRDWNAGKYMIDTDGQVRLFHSAGGSTNGQS